MLTDGQKMNKNLYDIIIIGSGVSGCASARKTDGGGRRQGDRQERNGGQKAVFAVPRGGHYAVFYPPQNQAGQAADSRGTVEFFADCGNARL